MLYKIINNQLVSGEIISEYNERSFSGEDCYLDLQTFSHIIDQNKDLQTEIDKALKSQSIYSTDYLGDSIEISNPIKYLKSLGFTDINLLKIK